MATLRGAWRYRVSAGNGGPGVSILWLGEVERLICNFCPSVTAHKVVWEDPSLRYISLLLGCWATNKQQLPSLRYTNICRDLKQPTKYKLSPCPHPSVTRSSTKVQLNLKLGFFSRRLWTWGQTSDKKCDSETTNLQLLCDLQALLFFQRDGPRAIAPRVTGLV